MTHPPGTRANLCSHQLYSGCSICDQQGCPACGNPVTVNDEGGCVGTDPGAYHFKAECLLEAVRREHAEVERMKGEWDSLNNMRLDERDHAYALHAALDGYKAKEAKSA